MTTHIPTYKYSYKAKDKLLSSLSVYNVGYQNCEPGYQWGPGLRDHYLIHHIVRGEGCYCVNGQVYDLKSGDSFLVYPGQEIYYRADEENPWEYAWVGFAGSDAKSILRNTNFSRECPILSQASISSRICQKIMDIYQVKGNSFEQVVAMTGALYSLLSLLMEVSGPKEQRENQQEIYVQKALQYIGERYSYPITVEDVAAYAGVSRSYLFRLFKKELQESPKEYLDSYRLHAACVLLKETDLSVAAIANSVGFEDNLYFSKAFKKGKGISPTKYRQMP